MKAKKIREMKEKERAKKLEDLKMELIKSKVKAAKEGASKTKQIKKIIARIHTINREGEMKQ